MPLDDWARTDSELAIYIAEETRRTLESYQAQPNLVTEHANIEQDTAHGGYQHRQLFELVQNSADALWLDRTTAETGDDNRRRARGQIEVRLTENFLYCADAGEPIHREGVKALMFSHLSTKRQSNQIGTFGLGFKAVLGVSDSPEFYSRSGSFRFNRDHAQALVKSVASKAESCPVLRLPEPIDPTNSYKHDSVARQLMGWATNIVRLPLLPGARTDLHEQMVRFPAEFLLFVTHVNNLRLIDEASELDRSLELEKDGDEGDYILADGDEISQWKLFEHSHRLSSDAGADRRPGDDRDEVPIWWAAPVDRLDRPGKFWAFFPTSTASLIPGILNAPWKTNEDRQNLLTGRYNDELIEVAANLIAEALPDLSTEDDPARHLDVLPRRHEAGDTSQSVLLRDGLFAALHGREIVPNQDAQLCRIQEISYPPKQLTSDGSIQTTPFERWAAHPGRPKDWLHHNALTRTRLATIDRLFHSLEEPRRRGSQAPRATISRWLESLVQSAAPDDAVEASMAAIQVAALIPDDIRADAVQAELVLTSERDWQAPDPDLLFLPDPLQEVVGHNGPGARVHPSLVSDSETLTALKRLGLGPPSKESAFRLVAEQVLSHDAAHKTNRLRRELWARARELRLEDALGTIREQTNWENQIMILARSGDWLPPHSILIPGEIVPGDGTRDDQATVDMAFHRDDTELLRELGVRGSPASNRDLQFEPAFHQYMTSCKDQYRQQSIARHRPRDSYLKFKSTVGVGPLTVLKALSDEGRVLFTDALLRNDDSYMTYEMWHKGTNRATYPKMPFESPMVRAIRDHGRLKTSDGIVPITDALGPEPRNPMALEALIQHPNAKKIQEAFNLSEPIPEFFGESEPIPLIDLWPGLTDHLSPDQRTSQLVLCEMIQVAGSRRDCLSRAPDVYLEGNVEDDERRALQLIGQALELDLTLQQIEGILGRKTPWEINERRRAVGRQPTDAARLLEAVGEEALRLGLPASLLAALGNGRASLTGIDIAEAAIATHHTDALRQFRGDIDDLDPPARWSGSRRATEFVRSLGFSAEWAGERNRRRPPFVEVEGPWSLPKLHHYQQTVAANVREMLQPGRHEGTERRGLLSMPTGSGKTRVAVQAIVEAMRDDGFRGGVLWVADRDELCEQAVESWEQVWRSLGVEAGRLRISRMWSGQPRPADTSELHVVVATVQTLHARLSNLAAEYKFLKDFKLLVFDEAHRSVAPTSTSVMQEVGLTHRRRNDGPLLLGLTATPYRGRNQEETARLVHRYGQNRLDAGVFDSDDPREVIGELQDLGVLARADQRMIEGGTFQLTVEELEEMSKFGRGDDRQRHLLAWLPASVEDRMTRDSQRTERIIEAYLTHIGPDWPTLIFATSVEHSKTLAALLNMQGITARAVNGTTESATRRRVVDSFRNGEIHALVNYGVFREGFDAPKTRAIIVARPVYSPNLYFQMIGRGLRGRKNGGDDRCLILNVRDTIDNFGEHLAFSDLDSLWISESN